MKVLQGPVLPRMMQRIALQCLILLQSAVHRVPPPPACSAPPSPRNEVAQARNKVDWKEKRLQAFLARYPDGTPCMLEVKGGMAKTTAAAIVGIPPEDMEPAIVSD